ncbi:hypothetical protein KAI32_03620 [Candidatus Pacearchaeota archaeon]|nr:hypothetical protein [Candidatus Pacearchaeota archaeon]
MSVGVIRGKEYGNVEKKNVLVIDNKKYTEYLYKYNLKKFNVNFILHNDGEIKIPEGKYDAIVVSGLHGDYKKVIEEINANEKINANKIIGYSCDYNIVKKANKIGNVKFFENNGYRSLEGILLKVLEGQK